MKKYRIILDGRIYKIEKKHWLWGWERVRRYDMYYLFRDVEFYGLESAQQWLKYEICNKAKPEPPKVIEEISCSK